MRKAVRWFLTAAAIGAVAAPAWAQVYPERLVGHSQRARESYRQRDRGGDNRAQAVDKFSRTVRIGSDGTLEV